MSKIEKWLSEERFVFERIADNAVDVKFADKILVSIDNQIANKIRIGVLLPFDPRMKHIEKLAIIVERAYRSGLIVDQDDRARAVAIFDMFENDEIRKHDVLHTCLLVRNLFMSFDPDRIQDGISKNPGFYT